ncbi:hypothetical protein [Maridesulfovibrio bastinii]|nr:hypothetical protein [Maridesulfovibrio bastinii]
MSTLFEKFTNRDELTIIADPCAIENKKHILFMATELKNSITGRF